MVFIGIFPVRSEWVCCTLVPVADSVSDGFEMCASLFLPGLIMSGANGPMCVEKLPKHENVVL